MGCPICGGGIGYTWGSDLPCLLCKQEYRKAAKDLPDGVGIMEWGSARNAKKKALAEGKAESEAEEAFSATIQKWLDWERSYSLGTQQAMLGDRDANDPLVRQLLGR